MSQQLGGCVVFVHVGAIGRAVDVVAVLDLLRADDRPSRIQIRRACRRHQRIRHIDESACLIVEESIALTSLAPLAEK